MSAQDGDAGSKHRRERFIIMGAGGKSFILSHTQYYNGCSCIYSDLTAPASAHAGRFFQGKCTKALAYAHICTGRDFHVFNVLFRNNKEAEVRLALKDSAPTCSAVYRINLRALVGVQYHAGAAFITIVDTRKTPLLIPEQ